MSTPRNGGNTSRAALYAQQRRDNEAEAREELDKRLPADAFRSDFKTNGDFNLTTKTLLAALIFINPTANTRTSAQSHANSAEYGQYRRANETTIRERLEAVIPQRLLTAAIVSRSDFNRTTKVMISASLRVKELLHERRGTDPRSSSLSQLENSTKSTQSFTPDLDEIPDSQQDPPILAQQTPATRNKQAVLSFTQDFCEEEDRVGSSYISCEESPSLPSAQPGHFQPGHFQPIMAPNTRSCSNSKILSPNTLSSPLDAITADENVPPPRRFDGIDLFAHLRTDERQQETQFNVKPPPLPKKVQNQGYWEVRPKDPKNLPYSSEYVRALEQAANRLVAKAKELVVVYEGNEDKYKKPIMEAEEMCIDTIDMLEADMDRKKYQQKWTANKATWKKDYPDWKFDE